MRSRIIYNPTAGPRHVENDLKQVRRVLRRRGWSVGIEATSGPGDATRLAREAAAAGIDAVWAAGGDGTVCEVVNGLAGTSTTMGVLPIGTGNIWAKQLRLPTYTMTDPRRLEHAAVAQVEGAVRSIDVGQIGQRYFLLWSGVGFDALVTSELEPRPRQVKRLGAIPYIIAAVNLARDFPGIQARIILDEEVLEKRVLMVLVSNIQMYTYFNVVKQARLDDGLLDVLVFEGLGLNYILRHAVNLLSGRHLQDPRITHRQVSSIHIQTEEPLSVQVDGDPRGDTPLAISAIPRGLRIFVPRQSPPSLFSKEEA